MIELKAELLKKKQEYEEAKNKSTCLMKKSTALMKSKSEPIKIEDLDHVIERKKLTEEELKRSRDALEAKSRLYQKLERGKLAESDLNKSQRENLMVDFAWKGWNPEKEDFDFDISSEEDDHDGYNRSDSEKGKLGIDQVLEMINSNEIDADSDRWLEYEDEFGRTRVAKLGQLRQIQKDREEVNKLRSKTSHYDGDAEIRNKGVGFYQFSTDEEERKNEMAELRKLRAETIERRVRTLLMREQRRLRIESRLSKLKERRRGEI